jgi:hypothetical protein
MPKDVPLYSDGPEAYLFQPFDNYRNLVFDKALSPRMVQKIVAKWGEFTCIGMSRRTTCVAWW